MIINSVNNLPLLAEGGEGYIYQFDNVSVLKMYKHPDPSGTRQSKLNALISKTLPAEVIRPRELCFDKNNSFVGYLMDKIEGTEFRQLGNRKFVRVHNISVSNIAQMLCSVLNVINVLHHQGVYIGDLNDANILFDSTYNVYFIDVDSWAFDTFKCSVAMDAFKDPMLVSNNFNAGTDSYALSVLIFKALTRLHPFGGIIPDKNLNLIQRKEQHTSVLTVPDIIIPRTVTRWDFMSKLLLDELKSIYDADKRFVVTVSLPDFANNLKFCPTHADYYYSKYSSCPLCTEHSKLKTEPVKTADKSGMPVKLLFESPEVKNIINNALFQDHQGRFVNRFTGFVIPDSIAKSTKIYFSEDNNLLYIVYPQKVIVKQNNKHRSEHVYNKNNNSPVVILDNKLFYISTDNNLIEATIHPEENYLRNLQSVSFNSYFNVSGDSYLVVNVYDNIILVNIDGKTTFAFSGKFNIVDYGIHYDNRTGRWLLILKDDKDVTITRIFNKHELEYETDSLIYPGNLGAVAFSNKLIFIPCDGYIRGYNKAAYKDFICPIITSDCSLIPAGNKFTVLTDTKIYEVG